jgi:hypothetical protein
MRKKGGPEFECLWLKYIIGYCLAGSVFQSLTFNSSKVTFPFLRTHIYIYVPYTHAL